MIIKQQCTQNFTIVPNSILRNSNLSLQAIGLCAYILSLPKEWKINIEQICLSLDISKNTAYKYLKELIQTGILKKARLKDEEGRFTNEAIYFIQNNGENELEKTQENTTKPLPKICEMVSVDKTSQKALKSDIPTTSQNLNAINKDSKDKKRESKNKPKSHFYILQSLDQKRLFSLCFARESKNTQLDTSSLNLQEKVAFERFIAYRKQKHRLTPATQQAILERFLKAKALGISSQEIEKAVEKSIMQGWQGIFFKQNKAFLKANTNKSPQAISDEILRAILSEYPHFDFSNVGAFLDTHLLQGRKVKYENALFCWADKEVAAQ